MFAASLYHSSRLFFVLDSNICEYWMKIGNALRLLMNKQQNNIFINYRLCCVECVVRRFVKYK